MKEEKHQILLESDTNELEIVEFRIDEIGRGGEVVPCYFGVNVAKVREIIRRPQTWKVFNSHSAIAGMMKLRDRVITVIDLSSILGKEVGELSADRVIVLEFNNIMVGVLVHSVSRIYRISWQQVEPPVRAINGAQVTGVIKMDDRIILILDFEKIIGELCSVNALKEMGEEQLTEPQVLDRSTRKVLVADDSTFIRTSICNSLRTAGYQVLEAENGEEAWLLIKEKLDGTKGLKGEVDLLITDVEMPRMDGLHLTSLVRKEARQTNLPILIFSSLASEDNKRKWKDLGANDIVTKPDLPNLVTIADSLM